MILQDLRKEKQGQKGERNKTIILLRVSTGTKPPKVASGERSGSVGQLVRLSNKKRNKMTEVLLRWPGWAAGRWPLTDGNDVSSLQFPDCQAGEKPAPGARTPVDIAEN